MYRALHSVFVVIMLATLVDDKNQTKPNKKAKPSLVPLYRHQLKESTVLLNIHAHFC